MNSVVLMNGRAARRHLPLQHPHHNRAEQEAHALAHQPRPNVNGNLRPPHRRLPCTLVSIVLLYKGTFERQRLYLCTVYETVLPATTINTSNIDWSLTALFLKIHVLFFMVGTTYSSLLFTQIVPACEGCLKNFFSDANGVDVYIEKQLSQTFRSINASRSNVMMEWASRESTKSTKNRAWTRKKEQKGELLEGQKGDLAMWKIHLLE